MGVEATRNSFRAAILNGEKPVLVVSDKNPQRDGAGDALDGVHVPRSETRRGNHRGGDRHRLNGETATAVHHGENFEVEIVNLSSGGAMIRCGFAPRLWDIVELRLGDGPGLEGAVRWIKGGSIGLEFAHETKIECDPKQRAELLLAVIQRSFPDDEVRLDVPVVEEALEVEDEDLGNRDEKRHPLIWKGEIHYAHDSNPVRLRNVSAGGALVDVAVDYPPGAEVMLDLGDAGQFFTTVQWVCGDQAGLRFVQPFDIACLANARPDVMPHSWTVPSFLTDDADDDSPWHEKWGRSSIEEIRTDLEGYLKR
ncbi:MAG TPA: PilZ domain-containing protein [Sphingomicrobium sp.]|nr:PilZ domain-containing protein [Sphingomicrobium sp.]